jgi:hypothetical protein
VAALLVATLPAARADVDGKPAHRAHHASGSARSHHATCHKQRPQRFLERHSYVVNGALQPEASMRAIRWRTEHYGRVAGFGSVEWNADEASRFIKPTTFMGLRVDVHEKIIPALACVEHEIRTECARSPYEPKALAGYRETNTFRGGEVTNHLFGIAVDVDPDRNPCCGCVEPWRSDPHCTKDVKTAYERMEMPRCWVRAFESYGFYWLGHDQLEDTMHFEFLGDPDKIKR